MPDKFQNKYTIESTRLSGYDYSQNRMYFITICTKDREHYFGEIINNEMKLSEIGKIIKNEWLKTSEIRKNIILDEWVIMPNHFHAIIGIDNKTINTIKTHFDSVKTHFDPVETHCNASQNDNAYQNGNVQNIHCNMFQNQNGDVPDIPETHCNASLQMQMQTKTPIQYKNKFGPQSNNLSSIIRGFKGVTTKNIHLSGFTDFSWQSRFYDHIINNENELNNIREYIFYNPVNWENDRNNVDDRIVYDGG